MSDYTDEEIGRAMREYWEFQGLGSAGDQISAIKELYARDAERRDLDRCTPYTTADLRAALAAEREAGAKTERINFDIWSDEYAPPADSPLLTGVFGAETAPPKRRLSVMTVRNALRALGVLFYAIGNDRALVSEDDAADLAARLRSVGLRDFTIDGADAGGFIVRPVSGISPTPRPNGVTSIDEGGGITSEDR